VPFKQGETFEKRTLLPNSGLWMVVINAASDPETALCKVDLEIKE
jgi:hypothetical protein